MVFIESIHCLMLQVPTDGYSHEKNKKRQNKRNEKNKLETKKKRRKQNRKLRNEEKEYLLVRIA